MKKIALCMTAIITTLVGYERINIVYKPEKKLTYEYKIVYTENKYYYNDTEYYRNIYTPYTSPVYKTKEKDVELYYKYIYNDKKMILIPQQTYKSPYYQTANKEIESYYRYSSNFSKEKHYSIQYLHYGVYEKGYSVINIYGNNPVKYYLHNGEIITITK